MRTTIILLMLSIPTMVQSQLILGAHAGVNYSNNNYTGILANLKTSSKADFFAGITIGMSLGKKLSLLGDVQYSRKGHSEEFLENTGYVRYQYLDIIPQLEYRLAGPLALSAGFNFGVKLGEQSKLKNAPANKLKNTIKPLDFGLVLTGKAYFHKFYGFIRYNLGINDIFNQDWIDLMDLPFAGIERRPQQSNRNWQFGLGFSLF